MSEPEFYVATRDLKAALEGREGEILDALNIDWRKCSKSNHLRCPYSSHGGDGLNWRWDAKQRKAHCTCQDGHADNALDVLLKCEGLDLEAGKLRAAEILGRSDLVKTKGDGKGQKTDPASLLSPPAALAAPDLPRVYLASRLGVEPAEVPMPNTLSVGWSALPYVEASTKGTKTTFNEVAKPPCAVFETVAADGRRHAHRIYTGEAGQGKADLGTTPDGRARDPKKSASAPKDAPSTAGYSALWGDPAKAERAIVTEGIETAAAVALAFGAEIGAGTVVVAAAIAANGVAAWAPYPATRRITVAADRDEAVKPSKPTATRAGEVAARRLGLNEHERGGLPVSIALPGERGRSVDWLDTLRADGVEAVRAGVEAAARFVPTAAELKDRAERAGREAELEKTATAFPLPDLDGHSFSYRHAKSGKVWLHQTIKVGKGESAELVDVPICSPFAVMAQLRVVDARESYGLRLALRDMGGRTRVVDIDRGIHLGAQAGVEARKTFLTNGVRFQNNGEIVAVNALKAAEPAREITIVKVPGWHTLEDIETPFFVAPDGSVYGLPEGAEVELSTNAKLLRPIARRGTLEGWKASVATALRVRDCPHWGVGLFAGFAGCLISLVEDDSCGVNLSGLSSSGKTTAQRLAVSPWSRPIVGKTSLMQSAKATANGAEAMASKANGSVLSLDELAHVTGRELTKIVYLVAGGTGKTRMDANADLRASYEWRTFGIMSSETSLEEKIRSDGGEWTAGQAVRIPDIDVTGLNRRVAVDVFDRIGDIRHHYGHAGGVFVEGLIANGLHRDPDNLRKRIGDLALKIAASGGEKNGADGAMKRAAYPFAVLMTAGQLAKDFGLIPEDTNVTAIMSWAWSRFKKSSDAVALDPEAQVVANLQRWIAERWGSSIHSLVSTDYDKATSKDAVGWFDDKSVYLSDQRLVEAAGVNLKETEIARALNSRGLLTKTKDAEHLSISFVPRAGRMKAYALSREQFGRGSDSRSALHAVA